MKKLSKELKPLLFYPVETNQAFLKVDNLVISNIKNKIDFEIWEKGASSSIIRFVTSFDTTNEEIALAINIVKEAAGIK